jgi:NurA-like 5'-3' nuclease
MGESERMDYQEYPKEELDKELLLQLPKENLQMIENNLKNAKKAREEVTKCYISNNYINDYLNGGQCEHADLQPLSMWIGGT